MAAPAAKRPRMDLAPPVVQPVVTATVGGQPQALVILPYGESSSMTDVVLVVQNADGSHGRCFYVCAQPLRLVSKVWDDALGNAPPLEEVKDGKRHFHMIEIPQTSAMGIEYLLSQFYPGAPPPPRVTPADMREAIRLAHRYDIPTVLQKIRRDALTTADFMTMLSLDVVLGQGPQEFEVSNYPWSVRQNMLIAVAQYDGKFKECYEKYLSKLPTELLARLCFDAVAFIHRDYGTHKLHLSGSANNQQWFSVWQ